MMRILVQILTAVVVLYGATEAVAADKNEADSEEKAKEQYLKGKERFAAGAYQEALDSFTEAYNASGKPDLLYNLAVCCEKLGDYERAIAYYELYVEEKPDAPDAAYVKKHVEKLKESPPPAPEAGAAQNEEPAEAETEQQPKKPAVKKDDKPKLRVYGEDDRRDRKIFWPGVAIGAGGLLIAGGVVTAIMARQEYNGLESGCAPDCTDDEMSKVRGIAVAADIQIIAGVAAAGAGAFLWIYGRRTQERNEVAWSAVPIGPMCKPGLFVQGGF